MADDRSSSQQTRARLSLTPRGADCSPTATVACRPGRWPMQAGVPLSQLHYHFGSKQGLILALLDQENQRRLARQHRMYAEDVTALAALRARLRLLRR